MKDVNIAIEGPLTRFRFMNPKARRTFEFIRNAHWFDVQWDVHVGNTFRVPTPDAAVIAERLRDNGVSMHFEGRLLR